MLLDDLALVLFALKLALGGYDGFNELAFGRFLELEVQAFDLGAPVAQSLPQLDVVGHVSGKALGIVKDDGKTFVRLRVDEAQERHHTGALHEVAFTGDIVREDGLHKISLRTGKGSAARFLAFQPVALDLL
ncbi:MAG: hypothetical protein AAF376_03815 [Pseudomonadota bacterium]